MATRKGATMAAETATYTVVRNGEEQFSIWPADRDVPGGWEALECSGSKAECLEFISGAWTDQRPLSLRRAMLAEGDRT
jgi:MbtH protein